MRAEEVFRQIVDQSFENSKRNQETKRAVLHNISVDFSHAEMDSGKTLARCVRLNVTKQWSLVPTPDQQMVRRCSGRAKKFLTSRSYQDCPFKWISQQHRATFYKECLERYDIVKLKQRARAPARELQELAFKIKENTRDLEMSDLCNVDQEKSECGIFGGVGLNLTKIGIFFTSTDQKLMENIAQSKSLIKQMKRQYQEISTFLLLYMKSNKDLSEAQTNFENLQSEVLQNVFDQYYEEKPRARNAANMRILNIQNMRTLGNALKSSVLSRLASSVLNPPHVWRSLTDYDVRVDSIIQVDLVNKSPWGKFGAQCKKIFSEGFPGQLHIISTTLDFAEKLLEIVDGREKFSRSLHHQIILTSRRIAIEIDDLYDAYIAILKISNTTALAQNRASLQRQVYSIHVEVLDGNWDYGSGAYLTLQDDQRQCRTRKHSFKNGWTVFSKSVDLRDCQFMEFNMNTLKVSVHSDQNTGLRDAVTIATIQISTDGNFLPSMTTNFTRGKVTVSGSSRSKPFKLVEMTGLKAIKFHTSNRGFAGTDEDVELQIKYGGEWSTDAIRLDNPGDDRERGQTDVYKGSSLKSMNEAIRDYLEYFPDDGEIDAYLKLQGGDAWSPDLFKLYFAGERGQDVVVVCHLEGGREGEWLSNRETKKLPCKKRKVRNPGKSLQMMKAHTCDRTNAGTNSDQILLRFCREISSFYNFSSKKSYDGTCCTSNLFHLSGGRNEMSTIDVIDGGHQLLDGGEALGDCEGFEMDQSHIFVGEKF